MLGDRVREFRESIGLSRKEFGEKVGVSQDVINNIERGRAKAYEPVLRLIHIVYGVSRHWLDTGEGDCMAPDDGDAQTIDAIARAYRQGAVFRAVMDAYLAMSEQDRAVLDNFIKNLAAGIAPDQALADPGLVLEKLGGEAASPVNIEYKSE